MAEFVMKSLVREAGLENAFFIASAATTDEETGNPVYPPVQRLLAQRGISCAGKTARRVTRGEFVHIFHGALEHYEQINTVADNAIPDVKRGDAFAAEIYDFYRAGILTGSDANGTFHPADSIKRSEGAAILIRMYDSSTRVLCTF